MNQNEARSFIESFVSDDLEHHGIKGQKHGVRHGPPYPLERGVSAAIKRRFKKKTPEERAEVREQRKAKKQEKAEEKERKEREEILRDPTKLYKNRRKFTTQEINDAMKTFEWEKKLKDYSNARLKAGNDKVNGILNRAEAGIRTWNLLARLVNSFADRKDDGDFRMPFIMQPPKNDELEKKKKSKGSAESKVEKVVEKVVNAASGNDNKSKNKNEDEEKNK